MGDKIVALAAKLGEREFTQHSRMMLADKGEAMPDGGYPIPDVMSLKRAIKAIGRAKNPAAVKSHIKKRAKALGVMDLIPEGW